MGAQTRRGFVNRLTQAVFAAEGVGSQCPACVMPEGGGDYEYEGQGGLHGWEKKCMRKRNLDPLSYLQYSLYRIHINSGVASLHPVDGLRVANCKVEALFHVALGGIHGQFQHMETGLRLG